MGSFFLSSSYSVGVSGCSHNIYPDYKMGSFGNILYLGGNVRESVGCDRFSAFQRAPRD